MMIGKLKLPISFYFNFEKRSNYESLSPCNDKPISIYVNLHEGYNTAYSLPICNDESLELKSSVTAGAAGVMAKKMTISHSKIVS